MHDEYIEMNETAEHLVKEKGTFQISIGMIIACEKTRRESFKTGRKLQRRFLHVVKPINSDYQILRFRNYLSSIIRNSANCSCVALIKYLQVSNTSIYHALRVPKFSFN